MKITFMNMNYVSPNKLNMMHDAVDFYANKLLSKRMLNNMIIKIQLNGDISANGTCEWDDHWVRPREFLIKLKDVTSISETLLTLAHEMVHVKQFAKEELKERFIPFKQMKWYNVDYFESDYLDQPWEIEAYNKQLNLYLEFVYNNEQTRKDSKKSI